MDLREIAIGVRIVKDGEKADSDAATEFDAPPKLYRNATMTFEHDFEEAGKYVAIVTVAKETSGARVSPSRWASTACGTGSNIFSMASASSP